MKYFVIATRWDDERKAQVKYIAGQFDSFANANIFRSEERRVGKECRL